MEAALTRPFRYLTHRTSLYFWLFAVPAVVENAEKATRIGLSPSAGTYTLYLCKIANRNALFLK